jgi:hypothetical protein
MSFSQSTQGVLPIDVTASNNALSSVGPLSKYLDDLRRSLQIATIANLSEPPVRIRTSGSTPGISATSSNSLRTKKSLPEELFDSLASFKIKTSTVAMYLEDSWRLGFFKQLDSLLGSESWDPEDALPAPDSFNTLLRMLLLLSPERRPGLGASGDGILIAAWTVGSDRLTIYCLPKDQVKWVLSCELEGARESAAGNSTLSNLREILSPYRPERWFRAKQLPQT